MWLQRVTLTLYLAEGVPEGGEGLRGTYLAARASCWWLKAKGGSLETSFLGSSRLRMLEMLKDLWEGGDDVLGELAPLSELLAGGLALGADISGVAAALRVSARTPTVVAGERRVSSGGGEGVRLAGTEGLERLITLDTSKDIVGKAEGRRRREEGGAPLTTSLSHLS